MLFHYDWVIYREESASERVNAAGVVSVGAVFENVAWLAVKNLAD